MSKNIFISTGESSGEFYGALLARQILRRWPDVMLSGIGGERMASSGVRLIARPAHAFGLIEAFSTVRDVRASFRAALRHMEDCKPDVLVLIDYPDFNMRLGKLAKRLGIKVLYYVSPQVWAWRKKRRFRIAEISDFVAVILPFEESIYRDTGARVEFVGHPVMEEIESFEHAIRSYGITETHLKRRLGIDPESAVITLLPGSRPSELKRLLPVIEGVVKNLNEERGCGGVNTTEGFSFVLPVAPNLSGRFNREFKILRDMGVKVIPCSLTILNGSAGPGSSTPDKYPQSGRPAGRNANPDLEEVSSSIVCLRISTLAIAASGTVVLQAALTGVPTIVIYRLSKLTYLIGRLVVKVRHISIPNIILGREVFPELLQDMANPDMIISHAKRLLSPEASENIRRELAGLREIFSGKRPSERVAEIIGELARW